MTRLFTFLLPPTPDAATTCSLPDADIDTSSDTIKSTGETQDLCLFLRLWTPKSCRYFCSFVLQVVFPRNFDLFGHKRLGINRPAGRPDPPSSSTATTLRPIAIPRNPPPTAKDLCSRPCAICHVVLRLLVVKDNWISVHGDFHVRYVL